jgi:hypothetical protein
VLWTLICLGIMPGNAENGMLLLIRDSKVPRLPDADNDAAAIAASFSNVGLHVVSTKTNADLSIRRRALRKHAAIVALCNY